MNSGISRLLDAAKACAITDHVCAWAAASPARYRASSSAKAASMSSRSNSDARRDPIVGVDLDDAEHLGVESPCGTSRLAARYATEAETLPAGRNDGRRYVRPRSRRALRMSAICDIPTMSNPGVHDPTAIVSANSRRPSSSAMASQSRAAKCAQKRSYDSACRVFQPRRRPAELVEAGERGVEVGLVEEFAAVDQVAFDRRARRSSATRRRSPLARSRAPRG